jgi:hypothetical protein
MRKNSSTKMKINQESKKIDKINIVKNSSRIAFAIVITTIAVVLILLKFIK